MNTTPPTPGRHEGDHSNENVRTAAESPRIHLQKIDSLHLQFTENPSPREKATDHTTKCIVHGSRKIETLGGDYALNRDVSQQKVGLHAKTPPANEAQAARTVDPATDFRSSGGGMDDCPRTGHRHSRIDKPAMRFRFACRLHGCSFTFTMGTP